MEILKRHREIQNNKKQELGEAYKETGFVCCHFDGSLPHMTHFSRWFRTATEEHGFEPIRYHDLRHSWASNMIRLGVPINTVSKMLGHASVSITMDTYAHVLEEMQEEAVGKMDADLAKYTTAFEEGSEYEVESPDWGYDTAEQDDWDYEL